MTDEEYRKAKELTLRLMGILTEPKKKRSRRKEQGNQKKVPNSAPKKG